MELEDLFLFGAGARNPNKRVRFSCTNYFQWSNSIQIRAETFNPKHSEPISVLVRENK